MERGLSRFKSLNLQTIGDPMTAPGPSKTNLSLLVDQRLLIYLFIGLRLMLILVHRPIQGYTPGLMGYGDFHYFYGLAQNVEQGKLPYRDYWFEYPPVLAAIAQCVYAISSVQGGGYNAYALLMALVLIAFDTGNIILLRRVV